MLRVTESTASVCLSESSVFLFFVSFKLKRGVLSPFMSFWGCFSSFIPVSNIATSSLVQLNPPYEVVFASKMPWYLATLAIRNLIHIYDALILSFVTQMQLIGLR